MCSPVRCRTCAKITWRGCGAHVAELRATIPADQWCEGHDDAPGPTGLRRFLGRGNRR
jgi:hypothetical protein